MNKLYLKTRPTAIMGSITYPSYLKFIRLSTFIHKINKLKTTNMITNFIV